MRKLAILFLIAIFGCENDFVPYNPNAKPVPIVFGFVDDHDSIHIIRLTKTFIGPKDAYELAKDTANLLYDSINMYIVCRDFDYNPSDTLIFHKTYFTPAATGNFNTGKSWYYVSTDKFPTGDNFMSYRLKAYIYDSGDSIFSSDLIRTMYRVYIRTPSKFSKNISVYDENVTTIQYSGNPICGVKIRFNYLEVSNNVKTEKRVETFWYNSTGPTYLTPQKLYTFIKSGVSDDPVVDYRIFKSLDILFYSGSYALNLYLKLFNSDRSFFSSVSFFETPYNYIVNGYGIFNGYTKDSITGLKFDQKTLDSLAEGQFTKELRFVPYQ
jgi:hypothetical protein